MCLHQEWKRWGSYKCRHMGVLWGRTCSEKAHSDFPKTVNKTKCNFPPLTWYMRSWIIHCMLKPGEMYVLCLCIKQAISRCFASLEVCRTEDRLLR